MALSFSCLIIPFFIFFLFPNLSRSCPPNPVPLTCGNATFDIGFPFFTESTDPRCRGPHKVVCDHSKHIVRFYGRDPGYVLKNLVHSAGLVRILDPNLSDLLQMPDCSLRYVFVPPIHLSENLFLPQSVSQDQTFFNCRPSDYNFSIDIFDVIYNQSLCRGYELFFSNRSEDEEPDHSECWNSSSPLFAWRLSFSEDGDELSIQSASYRHHWDWNQNCVGHDARRDFKCLCNNECPKESNTGGMDRPNKKSNTRRNIGIGLIAGVGVFFLASLMFLAYLRQRRLVTWKKSSSALDIEEFLEKHGSLAPKRYRYTDIKKITKNFHEKLGQGGFGIVFKGSLDDDCLVAVKILSDSKGNGEEFVNEVASIGKTSHVNIVSLLGFCLEGSQRALIYEFMPNGSLDKYIYSEKSEVTLELENLYQIAIGIARGLEYLHRGCSTRIVHFDIKPHNILLDTEFCPKISDFGLAKLCPAKVSIISMADPRGTIGYIAPEVFSRNFGVASSKSDVYSYGMMVLEMVGGRKSIGARVGNTSEVYFPHWIYKRLNQNGDLHASGVTSETEEIARKMILVGLWCIQTMPGNRPSMSKVVEMLQGSGNDLQMPPKPYLSSPLESFVSSSS